ncbi:MAG: hypothetical protein WBJ21_04035 [Burkholderiaceae bacterium]
MKPISGSDQQSATYPDLVVADKKSTQRSSAPAMQSPEKQSAKKLNLHLQDLGKVTDSGSTPMPAQTSPTLRHSEPSMTSPRRVRIIDNDPDHKKKEASPRLSSPRNTQNESPPNLRRILSVKDNDKALTHTQLQTPKSAETNSQASPHHRNSAPAAMIRMLASPRPDPRLPELSGELAELWIAVAKNSSAKAKVNSDGTLKSSSNANSSNSSNTSATASEGKLTETIIRAFGRQEYEILKTDCSPSLQAMLPNDSSLTVKHNVIIKLLFGSGLKDSPVGKTLATMKRLVVEQQGFASLSMQEVLDDTDKKTAAMADMQQKAKAVVDIAFGLQGYAIRQSQLPAELIRFWKTLDASLVAWAASNPELNKEMLKTARSNLGIDLILTRMVYPLVTPTQTEATLAAPNWFQNAVRLAFKEAWPAFFDDFILVNDAEIVAAKLAESGERNE